jgi:hypothetical protein
MTAICTSSLPAADPIHFDTRRFKISATKKFITAALLSMSCSALAGELDGFEGRLRSTSSGSTTYTWGLEYQEPFSEHLSAGFVWLNEGHLPSTHRDGQALQLLWRSNFWLPAIRFEAGIGPYRYYDTHILSAEPGFDDKHGWGALASGSLDWFFRNHWFTFLRVNEALVTGKYGSTGLAVGVGYQFTSRFNLAATDAGTAVPTATTRWELDGLIGERIGNTDHSETGWSEAVGARAHLSEHFTASLTYIGGQGTLLDWRDGFAAQLWAEQHLTQHFEAGVGVGAFIVSSDDNLQTANTPSNVAAIVSVTLAYSLSSRWIVRIIWDRIGTIDDHDADLIHFGLGYKF